MINSILNINVSCLSNVKGSVPQDVNLLSWLTSDKYRNQVENLRSIQDEDLQDTIKKSLPCITPSGRFTYRDEKHLIEHSGFIAFDVDLKDNKHITNFDELKTQLSHIKEVAYCGISVRGRGYWGLIPIPKSTPEEHKQRFAAILKDFKALKINLDPNTSDVCRLRIYSWDAKPYFNHNAELYTGILKPKPQRTFLRPATGDARDRVEAVVAEIKNNHIDITEGYDTWLRIAAALANEFGEGGRGYLHAVSQFNSKYNIRDTDRLFDGCLRGHYRSVTIGSFFYIAADCGVILKPEPVAMQRQGIVSTIDRPEVVQHPAPIIEKLLPDVWGVAEIERFFSSVTLPTIPMRLNDWTVIHDLSLFVSSHLGIVKANNGNARYSPYLDRLNELMLILN